MWGSSIYFWAVISIATVYITSFGLVILFSRNDKKKLKGNVKDYKSGIKILHSLLRIAAFMLNITAVVGIFGAKKSITVQVFSYIMLVIAVIKVFKEVTAIANRHRKKFKGYNGVKAVIFDLDGTLANTLKDLANAVNVGLEKAKLPTRSLSEIQSFIGDGAKMLIRRAVAPYYDKQEEVYAGFREYYDKHFLCKTRAYEGVNMLLDWLYYKGIRTAVVSNKYDFATKKITKKLFSRKINIAIGMTENINPKPAPDGIYLAMKHLKVSAEQSIYVGDSEVDFLASQACKMGFIGAGWGFGRFTSRCNIIDSPEKIIAVIEKKKKIKLFLP